MFEKIVIITRKTRLDGLVERFNTLAQAKFYVEHAGGDFTEYQVEHDAYQASLQIVQKAAEAGLPVQMLARDFLPTYLFSGKDLIVTLGQDGLVANTAKYAASQPIIAVNPDPARFDGILLPFQPSGVHGILLRTLEGKQRTRNVTLAEACLGDGQRLLAFNDLFLGAHSHVSARYRLEWNSHSEPQSSSGVLVSTGAGSTGWLSSLFNMVSGLAALNGGAATAGLRLEWEDERLIFAVREPFLSKHSRAGIVAGLVESGSELVLESQMPSGGVIFSDGIEADFLEFNSGARARIRAAKEKAHLIVG